GVQVEKEAASVVMRNVVRKRPETPRVIPLRRLDFDNLRSQVREQPSAVRPRDPLREVDDACVGQGGIGQGAILPPFGVGGMITGEVSSDKGVARPPRHPLLQFERPCANKPSRLPATFESPPRAPASRSPKSRWACSRSPAAPNACRASSGAARRSK